MDPRCQTCASGPYLEKVLECEADMEVGDGAVTAACCHSPVGRLLMSCHKACP